MKRRHLKSFLSILIIIVMAVGQALQAYGIKGVTLGADNFLPQISALSALDTQLLNEEEGKSKEESFEETLLPGYGESQSSNGNDKEGISNDKNDRFYEDSIQFSVIDQVYGADEGFDAVLLPFGEAENLLATEQVYGLGETANMIKPVPLAASSTNSSFNSQGSYSLQVKSDGTVWAWGGNNSGQLGDGTNVGRTVSMQIKDLNNIVAVAAGDYTGLALDNNGKVFEWGAYWVSNSGYYSGKMPAVKIQEGVIAIAAGRNFSLALKSDGTVWAWGGNDKGQLGNGTTSYCEYPTKVLGLDGVIAISAREYYSLALKGDGTVWAWGGNGTTKPVEIENLSEVTAIAAGDSYSLALMSDGTVWSWISNGSSKPEKVEELSGIIAISAGGSHNLALKDDKTVWAWGSNAYGQLGNGMTANNSKPIKVENLSGVIAIAAGESHSLALKADGTVWAWGRNDYGQLGNGTKRDQYTPIISKDEDKPTKPANLSASIEGEKVILSWSPSTDGDIVTGYEIYRDDTLIDTVSQTTCIDTGIALDKIHIYKVKAFDRSGNTSDAERVAINDTEAPSAPSNLTLVSQTITTVSLKWEASSDNLWVEGYEIYRNGEKIGETKDTEYTDMAVPQNKTHLYTVKAFDKSSNLSEASNVVNVTTKSLKPVPLAGGSEHSLHVQSDGTVWGWGSNSYGQLGNGTNTRYTAAVHIEGIQDVVAVASGGNTSFALKNDGTVWAWGYNSYGQLGDGSNSNKNVPTRVKDLYGVVALASGKHHVMALREDGTVWTWGYNGYGQLGNETKNNSNKPVTVNNLSNVIAIAAGENHSIALKDDGTVWAWGNNNNGQLGNGTTKDHDKPVQVLELSDVIAIAAGGNHNIALKKDGTVWTWGRNSDGQLGDGTNHQKNTPVQVKNLDAVTLIAAGANHSIALDKEGEVWVWGDNWYGQLGNGTNSYDSNIPVLIVKLSNVCDIAAGESHSLVLKKDGTVWAWGNNYSGRLGDGTTTHRYEPVLSKDEDPPTTPANLAAVIDNNSIVLSWTASRDGDIVTGYDIYRDGVKIQTVPDVTYTDTGLDLDKIHVYKVIACDRSGNTSEAATAVVNDTEAPSIPVNLIVTSQTVTTVSLEWQASTDNVWVEGYEIYRDGEKVGNTKDTKYTDLNVPHDSTHTYTVKAYDFSGNYSKDSNTVSVTTEKFRFVSIEAGGNNSIALRNDGTVWVWGYDYRTVAEQVGQLRDVISVAAGERHYLALKSDGTVWAWGNNNNGQLGDGTSSSKTNPVQVKDLYDVKSIAAGGLHSLALKKDGTVWSWGYNSDGQLGNGTTKNSEIPVQVQGLSDVIYIEAGSNYSLAIKSDGTVWAWGDNWSGQLGDGSKEDKIFPVQIEGLSDVRFVAAGSNYSFAIKNDGTVWAWGSNSYGQLGDGTNISKTEPIMVQGLKDISSIDAGGAHSIAITSVGTVLAWGLNDNGQLGDGTTTNRNTPVLIMDTRDTTVVSAGSRHSLALEEDGDILAWGYNGYGQLGNGTRTDTNKPVLAKDVIPPTKPTNVSATINSNGSVVLSWGASSDGHRVTEYKIYRNGQEIGTATWTTYKDTVTELDKIYVYEVIAVDAPGNLSEAESTVLNDTEPPSAPLNLRVTSQTITSVSLEWDASTYNLWVEGYEVYRNGEKIGDTKDLSYTDLTVPHNTTHTYIVRAYDKSSNLSEEGNELKVKTGILKSVPLAAESNSLHIQKDGTVWAWGSNSEGLLGDGSTKTSTIPKQVKGIYDVVAVATGNNYNLALKNDGTVWGWSGKITKFTDLNNVVDISVGTYRLALRSDGTVWYLRDKSEQVKDISGVVAIAAKENINIALKSDGTVWTFGKETVKIENLDGIIAISAGKEYSLALKSDGTVWTWANSSRTARQVEGLNNVSKISAGSDHYLVLKSDGTVWAWGNNYYGQLYHSYYYN